MKVWSAIFNFIGVWILILMISVYYNHLDAIQKDYDTAVLREVIGYAARAAFDEAINTETTYSDLGRAQIDVKKTLGTFVDIVSLSYNMSMSEENRAHIESYIPSAMFCTYDGYYITKLLDDDSTDLVWSLKIPYTMTVGNKTVTLQMDREQMDREQMDREQMDREQMDRDEGFVITNVAEGVLPYTGFGMGDGRVGIQIASLNRDIANARINTVITDALSHNIAKISEFRGGKNYRVYLPAKTTFSGINTIDGPSLIILLSGGDFAGKASISEAAIAGLKVVKKNWVLGFEDLNGNKWYAYETQLSEKVLTENNFTVVTEPLDSVFQAADMGYKPNFEILATDIKGLE